MRPSLSSSSSSSRAPLTRLPAPARSSHLTINVLAHQLLLSHLLPVLDKTAKDHPDADVRVVLEASELHRTTFGGPSESFGGDKFRTVDEFKKNVGQQALYARCVGVGPPRPGCPGRGLDADAVFPPPAEPSSLRSSSPRCVLARPLRSPSLRP